MLLSSFSPTILNSDLRCPLPLEIRKLWVASSPECNFSALFTSKSILVFGVSWLYFKYLRLSDKWPLDKSFSQPRLCGENKWNCRKDEMEALKIIQVWRWKNWKLYRCEEGKQGGRKKKKRVTAQAVITQLTMTEHFLAGGVLPKDHTCKNSLHPQSNNKYKISYYCQPFLRVRELRHQEYTSLPQGHIVNKWYISYLLLFSKLPQTRA